MTIWGWVGADLALFLVVVLICVRVERGQEKSEAQPSEPGGERQ